MTRLVSPGFTALQAEVEARENCVLEVNAIDGDDNGLAHLSIYVDGNVRRTPPRLRSQGLAVRELIPVEPGEHRVQIKDADTAALGRLESNVLSLRTKPGDRILLSLRLRGPLLHIEAAD